MSPKRRYFLTGLLSIGGLSGCLHTNQREDERQTDSTDTTGADDDPTVLQSRLSEGEPVVTDTTNESTTPIRSEVITDSAQPDELSIAPGVSDNDRDEIRTFLEETEYTTDTVFITHSRIRSCYRYQIQSISWDETEIRYRYCRELRPPEATCQTETWDSIGLLFRIPAALSSAASLRGTRGSSPCRDSSTTYDQIDATATVEGNTTAVESPDTRRNYSGELP